MAKSFRNKLIEQGVEIGDVVKFAGRYGDLEACDKYNSSLMPMRKLLTEVTGNENYGKNPQLARFGSSFGKTIAEVFFERLEHCIRNRILVLEEKIAKQNNHIELLERELDCFRNRELIALEDSVDCVISACQT